MANNYRNRSEVCGIVKNRKKSHARSLRYKNEISIPRLAGPFYIAVGGSEMVSFYLCDLWNCIKVGGQNTTKQALGSPKSGSRWARFSMRLLIDRARRVLHSNWILIFYFLDRFHFLFSGLRSDTVFQNRSLLQISRQLRRKIKSETRTDPGKRFIHTVLRSNFNLHADGTICYLQHHTTRSHNIVFCKIKTYKYII